MELRSEAEGVKVDAGGLGGFHLWCGGAVEEEELRAAKVKEVEVELERVLFRDVWIDHVRAGEELGKEELEAVGTCPKGGVLALLDGFVDGAYGRALAADFGHPGHYVALEAG